MCHHKDAENHFLPFLEFINPRMTFYYLISPLKFQITKYLLSFESQARKKTRLQPYPQ